MATSMRSFPAAFAVAMLVAVMVSAATATPDCDYPSGAPGLAVIGHEDVASINDTPAGTLQSRLRLQGIAERVHRATGGQPAVLGDSAPTLQVPSPRQFLMPDSRRTWIDDPGILTQASPRGPPSV